MDYFENVGELGLGSRLKRLSDAFMNEVKIAYSDHGFRFEPRWFPLFSLLVQDKSVTVTAAASKLNLTHPHISQLAKELARALLVTSRRNPRDGRSRVLVLSPKGAALAERFEALWGDIRLAVKEVLGEADPLFLSHIEKLERALKEKPFSARIREAGRARGCRIREFSPKLAPYFESLNREWIEKHFAIEPHDKRFFSSPEKAVIKPGGAIVFAELDGEIVGTCALTHEHGVYELAKLAVAPHAKGRGIGELLSLEVIKRAREKGAKSIRLTTNSVLAPAIRLYDKLGFKVIARGPHPLYKRCNLVMEKKL